MTTAEIRTRIKNADPVAKWLILLISISSIVLVVSVTLGLLGVGS